MTTPNTPPARPEDDELEARLHASWFRGVAQAQDDLAGTDVVSKALVAGRRRSSRRAAAGALMAAAGLLVVAGALIAGAGGRKEAVVTPTSPPRIQGTPAPSGGSQEPVSSEAPGDVVGIPYLDPGITFPPTVDGRGVVGVGPDADARIAAAIDDSPISLSGWLLGSELHGCSDFDPGSPAPDGVLFKDCTAIHLRASVDGGALLNVYSSDDARTGFPRGPEATQAMRVLMVVHVHDTGCGAPDCALKPVLERLVALGTPRVVPALLSASMPPGGLTLDQAIAIARPTAADAGFKEPKVLLSAEAGPRALVDDQAQGDETDWVWAVRFASDDGYSTYTVLVGYLNGEVEGAMGGSILPR